VSDGKKTEREGAVEIDRRLRARAAKMAQGDYELGLP
jgi:hypothetical protein